MEQVHHGFGFKNLLLIVIIAFLLMLSYLFQKDARVAYNDRDLQPQVLGESITVPEVSMECLFPASVVDSPPRTTNPNGEC